MNMIYGINNKRKEIYNLNEYIKNLENIYKSSPKCCQYNNSHSDFTADSYCSLCNNWLCEECRIIHKNENFYYCFTCSQTICNKKKTEHLNHKYEELKNIKRNKLFFNQNDIKLFNENCQIHNEKNIYFNSISNKYLCQNCIDDGEIGNEEIEMMKLRMKYYYLNLIIKIMLIKN